MPTSQTVVLGGNDLDRIRQLLQGKLPFELIETDTHYDDIGRLQHYALHTTQAGYLADRRNATMITTKLQGAVPGDWVIDVDASRDKVSGTRKKPFPPWIAPPLPAVIVNSPAEATIRYPQFAVGIGVDELGQRLEYRLKDYHHWLVIGGTGSGKSVFIRGIIETFRAAGWPVLIGDGKGTDYTDLVGAANVPMISNSPVEHVRLVHAAVEELDRRRKEGRRRKAAGDPNPMAFTPWLVILDEFATMRAEVSGAFSDDLGGDNTFVDDLNLLFRVAREFRIHMVLSTQDLYAKTIPRYVLSNCKLVITLGPPSKMTLDQAFTAEMAPKAKRIGELISPKSHGRGMVAVPETASVKEFQSYWGYSPGLNIDNPEAPDGIRGFWRSFKTSVSDVIPRLYSRQWFKVTEPDDLKLPMAELYDLEMVNLDLVDGTPDPHMYQYDKHHDDYNGNDNGATRDGALRELDLNEGRTPTDGHQHTDSPDNPDNHGPTDDPDDGSPTTE